MKLWSCQGINVTKIEEECHVFTIDILRVIDYTNIILFELVKGYGMTTERFEVWVIEENSEEEEE